MEVNITFAVSTNLVEKNHPHEVTYSCLVTYNKPQCNLPLSPGHDGRAGMAALSLKDGCDLGNPELKVSWFFFYCHN